MACRFLCALPSLRGTFCVHHRDFSSEELAVMLKKVKDENRKEDEGYVQLKGLETMIDFPTSFTSPHISMTEAVCVALLFAKFPPNSVSTAS